MHAIRATLAFCIVIVFAASTGGCTRRSVMLSPAEKPAQTPLRVMSFNIRYATANDGLNHWFLRRDRVVGSIEAFAPHILGTQETLASQRDFLTETLHDYAVVAVGRDDGKDAGEMTAIFYRRDRFTILDSGHFWLSLEPEKPGSIGWDAALTRMASWVKLRDNECPSGKPILFLNAHFDHAGHAARRESARLIRRKLAELGAGCAIVVTGDFNCTEDDPLYQQLFATDPDASALRDAYRIANPQRDPNEATFHAFNAGRTQGSRIDWIGIGDDWTVLEAAIDRSLHDGRLPSDHFPVTAVLRKQL
ncbi:MAG: endonuclease/exonuclease/phosphatase family protein [Burkholderiales bacterium]|nr:endonuclease/exonuclease/phosphatase family protein [Phycisphaerae bacterium]